MTRPRHEATFAALAAAALAAHAPGQTADPALNTNPPVPQWTIEFRPSPWLVAPGGRMRLPGAAPAAGDQYISDISLDKPRLSPLMELHVRQGPWRFTAGGFSYSIDQESHALFDGQLGDVFFASGDLVRSHLDFSCVEATAGYRVIEKAMNPGEGVYAMVFSLDVVGGARAYDMSIAVERPEISQSNDHEFFADALLGVKVNAELYDRFTVDVQTEIGFQPVGDRTAGSWDVMVGGTWRPHKNVGLRFGFRQLLFDLQSGSGTQDFKYRGGLAGVFGGIELRF